MVKDILPGFDSSFPSYLTNVCGMLFFTADDGAHGRELWAVDVAPCSTTTTMAPTTTTSVTTTITKRTTEQTGLPTTTTTQPKTTTTTTAIAPAECGEGEVTGDEQCDDGNIVDGDCCSSTCQFESGFCEDGNACTTAGVCSGGACQPGTPLGLEGVAGSLTGASQTPDACTGRKDRRLSRKVTKLIASAQKKLAKAAQTTKEKRQQKLTRSAVRKADKLSAKLSPECHAAIDGQVELAGGQVGCVQ